MAIYIGRTEIYDDGARRVYQHCYWDAEKKRAITRDEARASALGGHDFELLSFGMRERDDWGVSREGLRLCPEHAKELAP